MSPEAEEIAKAAVMCDHLAAMRERHEGVNFEHGNRLIDMLEKHAKLIARLLRAEAVRMDRTSPVYPPPPLSERPY
jgi:hypothetical protein